MIKWNSEIPEPSRHRSDFRKMHPNDDDVTWLEDYVELNVKVPCGFHRNFNPEKMDIMEICLSQSL